MIGVIYILQIEEKKLGNKNSDDFAGIKNKLWNEYETNSRYKDAAPMIAMDGRLYCPYCGEERLELESAECVYCHNEVSCWKLIYNLDCYNSKCVYHDAVNGCRKKFCFERETTYTW